MSVYQSLVRVFMIMMFREVQPNAHHHERSRNPEWPIHRLAEKDNSHEAAYERRGGEIGTCARRAQMAQRINKQYEAHPIAHESQHHGGNYFAACRQFCLQNKRQRYVCDTSHQPLHGRDGARVTC